MTHMPEDEFFRKQVLEAFKRVKTDIEAIKSNHEKDVQEIKQILAQIGLGLKNFEDKLSFGHPMISSGVSLTHSLTHDSLKQLKQDLNKKFEKLTKKELALYLTIYQLEDDLEKEVKHTELAKQLDLTEDGVRSYISRILKKGVPLVRKKHNNKTTLLSIPLEIRDLNLKKRLLDLYYTQDPTQKRLFDST